MRSSIIDIGCSVLCYYKCDMYHDSHWCVCFGIHPIHISDESSFLVTATSVVNISCHRYPPH